MIKVWDAKLLAAKGSGILYLETCAFQVKNAYCSAKKLHQEAALCCAEPMRGTFGASWQLLVLQFMLFDSE